MPQAACAETCTVQSLEQSLFLWLWHPRNARRVFRCARSNLFYFLLRSSTRGQHGLGTVCFYNVKPYRSLPAFEKYNPKDTDHVVRVFGQARGSPGMCLSHHSSHSLNMVPAPAQTLLLCDGPLLVMPEVLPVLPLTYSAGQCRPAFPVLCLRPPSVAAPTPCLSARRQGSNFGESVVRGPFTVFHSQGMVPLEFRQVAVSQASTYEEVLLQMTRP